MSDRAERYGEVMPDLAELCRNHDVGLELISCCDDVDQLLERVLTEFEQRLETVSIDSLEQGGQPASYVEAQRLRALMMFSSQAAALKEKAVASEALRERAKELEQSNRELAAALAREARARHQLDEVLESVDAERHRLDKLSEIMKTFGVLGHKINNPLTSLMGRAQILQMNRDLDPQVLKAAQVIEEASRRISLYIRELADLAKEGKAEALMQALEMPETTEGRSE